MENPEGFAATLTHNQTISHLASQTSLRQHPYYVVKMNVNGASMTSGLAYWKMQGLCRIINP